MTRATDSTSPDPPLSSPANDMAATNADPDVGLRAVRSLRSLAERLEFLQVERARSLGWSWQDIADRLGVTRQAVHKKYGTALSPRRK